MLRMLPVAAALAVVVSTGYAHGLWTDRWTTSRALEEAIARLDRVPMTIGDWRGQADTLDARALTAAGIKGYLVRSYVNARDGKEVRLLIVAGRPAPISEHPPDVCYLGNGFKLESPSVRYTPPVEPARSDTFWLGRFRKQRAGVTTRLRILWSWNASGAWVAPDNPRLAFAGYRSLYKMYVISQEALGDKQPDDRSGDEFVRELMPELQKALFSSPGATPRITEAGDL